MKRTCACVTAIMLAGMSGGARAALVDRGGGLVYDQDFNITWLSNANLAGTNTFGISGVNGPISHLPAGLMTWDTAQRWIGAMNTTNYLGYNDWRLPITPYPDPTCPSPTTAQGPTCTGSEMSHLFYHELGGVRDSSILTTHNPNFTMFQNVMSYTYRSGTESAQYPTIYGYGVDLLLGRQLLYGKNNIQFAWAVRSGDVVTTPIPTAIWLFGSGLLGLIAVARRRTSR